MLWTEQDQVFIGPQKGVMREQAIITQGCALMEAKKEHIRCICDGNGRGIKEDLIICSVYLVI